MTAFRTLLGLVATLALVGVAEAQKGGGKPSTKNTPPTGAIADVNVFVNAPDTDIDLFASYEDAQDPDTALVFSVSSNTNPALFSAVSINTVNGTLTLSYAPEQIGMSSISVLVTDTGGRTLLDTFNVAVINNVILNEEFSHGFNEAWTSDPLRLHDDPAMWYRGARVNRGSTSVQFEPSGHGAELLNRTTQNYSNYGFISEAEFSPNVVIEARIKTPSSYSSGTMDGVFNLLVVNAEDRARFVSVGINGGSASGEWCYHDWTDERHPLWAWELSTWYRLKITDSSDFGVEVSIWSDDESEKIHAFQFPYSLRDIGSTFHVAITQNLDALGVSMPVFIDFVRVSAQ